MDSAAGTSAGSTSATGKPRLLVLSSTYPRYADDAEPAFVHELSRRLAGTFEVTALVPHARGALREEMRDGLRILRYRYAPTRLQTLVNDGGILTNLKKSPWKWLLVPGFVIAQAWSLRRLAREWRPDIVHAHWFLPQGLLAAASLRAAPIVVTSHGADLFALPGSGFRILRRWVARRFARMTVVSQAMKDRLEAEIGADGKVGVEPMGVDLQARFTPGPPAERSATELLFVGRLVEKKGLRHLIDALPAIAARCPDVHLTVVGFGPEEPALREQAGSLGVGARISFLGAVRQADLPALYRRAAIFVAPFVQASGGDQEGLGLVLVEAMGSGCPVIAGDVPAVRDVVDANTGVRVPCGDARALAEAVVALLVDEGRRRAFAASARHAVLRRFDWEAVAGRYAALLQAVRT
jgi:glycosyltransferase involved in cell wall biosynthesis